MSWAALALYLVLAAPPVRSWLEASMTGHMLVQLPLLVAVGWLGARALAPTWREGLRAWAGGVVPLVLAASFAAAYWMLPRALDAALAVSAAEAAKFMSVPLLVGLPLGLAWEQLGVVGRGFVLNNFASMLAVTGWLYLAAPLRVCNSYLATEQVAAGRWMVIFALALFVVWLADLLAGHAPGDGAEHRYEDLGTRPSR